jgi:phage gp46-like protein
MFDVATRYAPHNPLHAGLAIPFDWVLTQPTGANLTAHDYGDPCAAVNPVNTAIALQVHALALEDTLQTAILISLFTNARAGVDVALPLGQDNRQGWVGSGFTRAANGSMGDDWGSLLWTIYVSKSTTQILERARFYAQEALAWLVRDGIAERVVVEAEWHGQPTLQVPQRLALRVQLYKTSDIKPIYDVLWGTSLARGASNAGGVQASKGMTVH